MRLKDPRLRLIEASIPTHTDRKRFAPFQQRSALPPLFGRRSRTHQMRKQPTPEDCGKIRPMPSAGTLHWTVSLEKNSDNTQTNIGSTPGNGTTLAATNYLLRNLLRHDGDESVPPSTIESSHPVRKVLSNRISRCEVAHLLTSPVGTGMAPNYFLRLYFLPQVGYHISICFASLFFEKNRELLFFKPVSARCFLGHIAESFPLSS